ncbi:hypothetical protein MES5069_220134 [Mesorhizobium escarrei]|uniref:Uncharacterized protein n=1 Tax=Mesorhizobium escarrei TaxID=666018 RepID=A0ABN8JQM5_9HYPH|nr:hypothetical protein MES5069_220134 [Mesorhizobium escarrei]
MSCLYRVCDQALRATPSRSPAHQAVTRHIIGNWVSDRQHLKRQALFMTLSIFGLTRRLCLKGPRWGWM